MVALTIFLVALLLFISLFNQLRKSYAELLKERFQHPC
jgi:hypothetical protein